MTDFPFRIVGFDLDGTLLDTAADLAHALNHILGHIGREPVSLDLARTFIGGGTGQMLRSALARSGGDEGLDVPALQEILFGFYARNIARHTALFPGAEAMMEALAKRGVHLAIATNKREDLAHRLIRELGLTPRFATIIGGDTLGPGRAKPAPDMLHEMARRCGGGAAAFVGDTTFDIGAARAAQMPVIAVSFGFHDLPPRELGADAVIDHFDDLIPALETIAAR